MKTIAIDVRMIHHSGIGTYISHLIPGVIKTNPEFEYYLLGPEDVLLKHDWVKSKRIKIINCEFPIYSVSEQYEFALRIPKKSDLFWAPHYNIPLFYRGKLLVTVHDLFHLAEPRLTGGIHKRIYARMMFSFVNRKADSIICISEFTKKELLRLTHCKENKIRLIQNGIDQSWREVAKQQSPYHKPFLLFVGNVKPNKNLVNLLRAYQSIMDQIEPDLVIVGKKEGFITGDEAVFTTASKLGSRIHFTGYIDEQRLIQYYKHAEGLVFPSIYEGFGLPPLEAMICGCPVIVSNTASMPEVCGDAVLYCNPYEPQDIAKQILHLLNDHKLQNSLRLKGIRRAECFSWDQCVNATAAVIKEVLDH